MFFGVYDVPRLCSKCDEDDFVMTGRFLENGVIYARITDGIRSRLYHIDDKLEQHKFS